MKYLKRTAIVTAACMAFTFCTKPIEQPDTPQNQGYVEPVPETISFKNADFIYSGDDMGEAVSDGWIIKMYTDMQIDEAGNPIGPGCVMQMLLNVLYDEEQTADPEFLVDKYVMMPSSMNFAHGTFVKGYMTSLDLPGGKIQLADATFYADLAEGSTVMEYDLIDDGYIDIVGNEDGTYTISGILVGNKFTKRYFTWTGEVNPRNDAPQVIPNSTLKADINNLNLVKGQLQDKGDYFFLQNQTYRCYLIFLGSEGIDFSTSRPGGTGDLLRLEVLVPWENTMDNGIPEGEYVMVKRNENTSINRDDIKPGAAIPGLPDSFNYPYISGSWYISLDNSVWTETYGRIDGGTISISKEDDGRHTISYDLTDCQNQAKSITGTHTLNIDIYTF